VATFNVGLKRDGPGLLLRDILKGEDTQIAAAIGVIAAVDPDILLLTNFDFDLGLVALTAFSDRLADAGASYTHRFALPPNSGLATGLDLNADGKLATPDDAQGYGKFAGYGAMALLSRYPIDVAQVQDFSQFLWRDMPGASLSKIPALAAMPEVLEIQRLSSKGHWDVPIILPDGTALHLLAFHASTPAFGGSNGRNTWRNRDEVSFWKYYLNGQHHSTAPVDNFVILGDANLDPNDGQGQRRAISDLIAHPLVQDPKPTSAGATQAALLQGGVNALHTGNPALDTADWRDTKGPGNLRVDYVLPSMDLQVLDAGVFWPATDDRHYDLVSKRDPKTSWHGLVWVDLAQ